MAEVKPFKALLYNKNKIGGDYAAVIAPPYDVISDEVRNELYEKDEHNIIRLILGKDNEGDTPESNKYTRAKEAFEAWQNEEVLAKDDKESFYVYKQEYVDDKGQKSSRTGFMGLMKIEGDDIVLPHEHTLAKPKEDRMNLIKQVESNLSPIFTIYDDEGSGTYEFFKASMAAKDPIIDIDVDGIHHQLWGISDADEVQKIVTAMSDKKIFIADGHHRYEVARTYRDLKRQEKDYDGSADYIMMYFAPISEGNDMTIWATHRVIKEMPFSGDDAFNNKVSDNFEVSEYDNIASLVADLDASETFAFGYFGGDKFLLVKTRDEDALLALEKEDKTDDWKRLDVSIMHSAVLDQILGVSAKEGNITYVKSAEAGQKKVDDGSHNALFLLRPTLIEQLRSVAQSGEMMPQKSTYFYPKLLTGLIINKFEGQKVKT